MDKRIYLGLVVTALVLTGCVTSKQPKSDESGTPHQLIKENKIDAAKNQFMMPSDINGIDADGNTVLHLAAQINDPDLITFFIIKGADTELKNYNSETPLHVAIDNDSFEAAKQLVAGGASLFSYNGDYETALDCGINKSSAYYDIFVTEETGKLQDEDGKTIVHYFVEHQNPTGIEYCIKNNLPISIKDNDGKTPLDLAFEDINNEVSVQIAALLIYGGAEPVETDFSYFQDALISRNLSYRFDDGQTPLHLGSSMGHTAIVKYLLENNSDFTAQDSTGATPLHEAVRYGNIEIARMLLNSGAKINAKDNIGKSPIMLILPRTKTKELYSLLISYRADIKDKDMFGDTVLHTAAMMKSDSEVVKLLINSGADVNARNKEGVTPLEIAVQNKDLSTIKLLTLNGANIHTQNTHGDSPLSLALADDEYDMETGMPLAKSSEVEGNAILEAVVNKTNVLSQDSDGNTPLHIALMNDADLSKVQYIVSLMDDVNFRNKDGNSALYYAIMKNRQNVGDILLEKNADIFSTNTNNDSPLRLALKYKYIRDWLINSKTIVATDGSGNTALHYAAEWEYPEAISYLLTKGSDISAKNANGETPVFSATKTNNPEIIQLIADGGADISARDNLGSIPLHTAVRWDADQSLEKLIEMGVNVNAQNISGKSALSEACLNGKMNLATALLDNGADPNACDINGVTILMDAIRGQNYDVVKMLLSYGANPNVQEVNGRNSYHEAALSGNIKIIALIRDSGVNPLSRDKQGNTPFSIVMKKEKDKKLIKTVLGDSYNITDSDGNSPIHLAVKAKSSDSLIQFLIDEGYPVDTRNADGFTALNYAIQENNTKTALLLLKNEANPFQMIDKKRNGVTIALENNNKQMISNIVKYAGKLCDIQGNSILHYAAKTSSAETVKTLLSYGLDKSVKNVSGETAYTIAVRWKRSEIAELLK